MHNVQCNQRFLCVGQQTISHYMHASDHAARIMLMTVKLMVTKLMLMKLVLMLMKLVLMKLMLMKLMLMKLMLMKLMLVKLILILTKQASRMMLWKDNQITVSGGGRA